MMRLLAEEENHQMAARMQEELDKGTPSRTRSVSRGPLVEAWRRSSPPESAERSDGEEFPRSRRAKRPAAAWGVARESASSPAALVTRPRAAPTDPGDRKERRRRHRSPVEPSFTKSYSPPAVPANQEGGGRRRPAPRSGAGVAADDDRIVSMGFNEVSARRRLEDAVGDEKLAVSMLLSGALDRGV